MEIPEKNTQLQSFVIYRKYSELERSKISSIASDAPFFSILILAYISQAISSIKLKHANSISFLSIFSLFFTSTFPEINDSAWIAVCEILAAFMSTSCKAVISILLTGGFCTAGVGGTLGNFDKTGVVSAYIGRLLNLIYAFRDFTFLFFTFLTYVVHTFSLRCHGM
ncbi:hypothetical protein T12_14289 [Trichinella patagoniensis]|uniref:Uncharacterized protein n=1 Tax=Trichinella patagoniensis TaxID=990121 RepID=A0A0V1A4D9_9BILA|nr:hypothetical protein T12_14289 [Trichinella patagoniensis]